MRNIKKIVILLLFSSSCNIFSFDIGSIKLKDGFKIEIYVKGISAPRGLTVNSDDTLFVGSKNGFIYKITSARNIEVIAEGLNGSIGVDFNKGDLYVSEIDGIRVFKDIDSQRKNYTSELINVDIPNEKWHGWKYLKVGSDDKIYINIGAPCNLCSPTGYYGTISRMDKDGSNFEVYAEGVRNSVGFDWSPIDDYFWFTDNGPDGFGDGLPPDEVNRVSTLNQHFGFPFIHGGSTKDPKFYKEIGETKVVPPEYELPAHVAVLGMRFYTGKMFPNRYYNGIFLAEHGSWNSSTKVGYKISFLQMDKNKILNYEVFASGFEKNGIVEGRPVDIEQLSDGSIIISDDFSGNLYRIYK